MTKSTKRRLVRIGVLLVVSPALFVVILAVVTYLQPRQYEASMFVQVNQPKIIETHDPTIIYGILVLVALFVPGVALLLTGLLSRTSEPIEASSPNI